MYKRVMAMNWTHVRDTSPRVTSVVQQRCEIAIEELPDWAEAKTHPIREPKKVMRMMGIRWRLI